MTTTKENYIGTIVAALLAGIIGTWIVMTVQQLEGPSQTVVTGSSDVLKGLKGVRVLVEEMPEGLANLGMKDDDVTAKVEFALRRNGVRVFTKEEANTQKGIAVLYLRLNSMEGVYTLDISCLEDVLLERAPGVTAIGAEVWDAGTMAHHAESPKMVGDMIMEYIDKFSDDFLKANPK